MGTYFLNSHIFEIFLKGTRENTSTQASKGEQALVLHVNRLKTSEQELGLSFPLVHENVLSCEVWVYFAVFIAIICILIFFPS